MALLGRKKSTIGLDIGSGLIKVAVIDHSKKGQPELTRIAIQPLVQDAIVEGEVMDPGVVAEAIQAALASAGVKSKSVVKTPPENRWEKISLAPLPRMP